MPSACPGFAAVIPALPVPAPVWLVGEDSMLAPRSICLLSSWADTATQSCTMKRKRIVKGSFVNKFGSLMALTKRSMPTSG